jgi:hypothetical protein
VKVSEVGGTFAVWFGGFPTSKKEALVPLQQKKTSVLYLIDEAWTTPSSSGTSTTDLSVACSVAPWRFGQLSMGKEWRVRIAAAVFPAVGLAQTRACARPQPPAPPAPAGFPFIYHATAVGGTERHPPPARAPEQPRQCRAPTGSPDAERNYLRFCDYY